MNHKHVACFVAGLLATTAAFAASAQSVAASAEVAVDAQSAEIASDQDEGSAIDRLCPRHTGTRIVARDDRKKRCTAFGRVYTGDDLQRTGATNVADALRMLDPSIR